jgi:hypothetical protein
LGVTCVRAAHPFLRSCAGDDFSRRIDDFQAQKNNALENFPHRDELFLRAGVFDKGAAENAFSEKNGKRIVRN